MQSFSFIHDLLAWLITYGFPAVLADPIFSTSRIRAGWSLVSSAIREEITGHDSFTSIVISHGESHSIAIIDRVFVSL